MRVSRLYTTAPLSTGKTIELDEDNGHYVRTVLRLRKVETKKLTLETDCYGDESGTGFRAG